jgi:hypothetical protein
MRSRNGEGSRIECQERQAVRGIAQKGHEQVAGRGDFKFRWSVQQRRQEVGREEIGQQEVVVTTRQRWPSPVAEGHGCHIGAANWPQTHLDLGDPRGRTAVPRPDYVRPS